MAPDDLLYYQNQFHHLLVHQAVDDGDAAVGAERLGHLLVTTEEGEKEREEIQGDTSR